MEKRQDREKGKKKKIEVQLSAKRKVIIPQLPAEIWVRIISHLNITRSDLLQIRTVNKTFQACVRKVLKRPTGRHMINFKHYNYETFYLIRVLISEENWWKSLRTRESKFLMTLKVASKTVTTTMGKNSPYIKFTRKRCMSYSKFKWFYLQSDDQEPEIMKRYNSYLTESWKVGMTYTSIRKVPSGLSVDWKII